MTIFTGDLAATVDAILLATGYLIVAYLLFGAITAAFMMVWLRGRRGLERLAEAMTARVLWRLHRKERLWMCSAGATGVAAARGYVHGPQEILPTLCVCGIVLAVISMAAEDVLAAVEARAGKGVER